MPFTKGFKHTDATKAKMSATRLGRKHSKAHCEAIGNGNRGKKRTQVMNDANSARQGGRNPLLGGGYYQKVHRWIKKLYPETAKWCDACGPTEKQVDWCNISQKYLFDITDWRRMCGPCHHAFDIKAKGIL